MKKVYVVVYGTIGEGYKIQSIHATLAKALSAVLPILKAKLRILPESLDSLMRVPVEDLIWYDSTETQQVRILEYEVL